MKQQQATSGFLYQNYKSHAKKHTEYKYKVEIQCNTKYSVIKLSLFMLTVTSNLNLKLYLGNHLHNTT